MSKHEYISYTHHSNVVNVRADLQGLHRTYCMCYDCVNFFPGETNNCLIAQHLFEVECRYHLVAPVWECPKFIEKEENGVTYGA